jgi:hypothetical protein
MTLKQLIDRWVKFLFQPQSPMPIALFRIAFGTLLLQSAVLHVGENVLVWYGPHGLVSPATIQTYWWKNFARFDLFLLFPQTEASVLTLWCIYLAAIVLLTGGLFTRVAAIFVQLMLITLHNREPFNLNGGDAMMRHLSLYLMFSNSGAALSVDRLIERFRHPQFGADSKAKLIVPCGQRMIQLQLAIAYGTTTLIKLSGKQWWDGTAVYYASRLQDIVQNPLPIDHPIAWKLMSWYTLVIEGAMATLVWLKDLRYFILAGAAVLHLGIDYTMNLPVFEWTFLACFLTFIYPKDLTRVMDFVKRRITRFFGGPAKLFYNPHNRLQPSLASVIEGLDVFARLEYVCWDDDHIAIDTVRGRLSGAGMFAWLTAILPLLWLIYPVVGLPYQLATTIQRRNKLRKSTAE